MNDSTVDAFIEWWETEVNRYADSLELPVSYIEEEFIIDGELIKVPHPTLTENDAV